MALGLQGRLTALQQALDPSNRLVDQAAQLQVKETGEMVGAPHGMAGWNLNIWGGVWDKWTRSWTGELPREIITIEVSQRQLDFILDQHERVSGKGGRGGGKSEALAIKSVCRALTHAGFPGQIVSPTYKLVKVVWTKLLGKIPRKWLLKSTAGINRSDKILTFQTMTSIRFVSAHDPDSLRSWDGNWTGVDEEKDIDDEAIDVLWGSMRLGPRPQVFGAGTPEAGQYEERWNKLQKQEEDKKLDVVGLHSFPSRDNPFIDKRKWEIMKTQMDERRYRQEILAEFVPKEQDRPLVAPWFTREKHCIEKGWPIPDAEDITREVTRKKLNISRDFIVGVDANWDYPNYAVVFQVFRVPVHGDKQLSVMTDKGPRHKRGTRDIWVAVDVIAKDNHCGRLAKELKSRGYGNCAIVPDVTAKGPIRMMRGAGLKVFHSKRNPYQTDSVNDFAAKMAPVDGLPGIYILMPTCQELTEALELAVWMKSGKKIDKALGVDHVIDAFRYPISHFYQNQILDIQ